ncbi:MAG: hypothetical protein ABIA37_02315 [Candidatus Woesearchaeota archaeon]
MTLSSISLEELASKHVKERELISVKRDSIIYKITLTTGETFIEKNFFPEEDYRKDYFEHFSKHSGIVPFMGESYQYPTRDREHKVSKESEVLKIVGRLAETSRFAPNLEGILGTEGRPRSVIMNYLEEKTYGDSFNSDYRNTAEMTQRLIELHHIFGTNFQELYNGVCIGRRRTKALRPRNIDEEKGRWHHYFQTLVYYLSPKFKQFITGHKYSEKRKIKKGNEAKNKERWVRKKISEFLNNQHLNFGRFIEDFIQTDFHLTYGNKIPLDDPQQLLSLYKKGVCTIIHGDYYPQNVFKTSPVKTCDFLEMRVASRYWDLVTLLYNLHNFPTNTSQEFQAIEQIAAYVKGVNNNEPNIALNLEEAIIGTQETRLRNLVRIFALDCKFNEYEIRKYVQGIPRFDKIEDSDLRDIFLKEMFIDNFQHLSDYLLRGEGYLYTHKLPKAELLYNQIRKIESFFEITGIISEPTEKAVREKNFKKLIGVDK